ncbi:MAG: type II toxin-antitoxin system MqsA family antitoxin [Candidatus Hydrogenedentota bacterium]
MKCVICKNGETVDGETTVTIERDGMVLVLRGVPARVCGNCGEAYVSGDVTDQILLRAEEMQRQGVEVDVRRFVAA